jgi:maltooligosyltrehalose trehalohydrolase
LHVWHTSTGSNDKTVTRAPQKKTGSARKGSCASANPRAAEFTLTTLLPGGGVRFRVWAPKRKRVHIVLEGRCFPLSAEGDGYFAGTAGSARTGSLYRFRLDEDSDLYPDPESRFQPEGPHGPSQVIDPSVFSWTDSRWKGVDPQGQIVYELHIGTFTPEGTWDAARKQLPELASVGISVIEVMPIAEFGGARGWGYDGVDLFAPMHLYGSPDDVRNFVNEAHILGLGVILDVVYNHFGPDGNYVKAFADEYFTDRYSNDWGESINFSSGPVREFYMANAACWIGEYHFDGLRLDATQDIHDTSEEHILAAIVKRVRKAAGDRKTWVVAENEPQHSWMVRAQDRGGYGISALWNDDFHHSARAAMTGRREAYYSDCRGSPQELLSAAKYGYLFQGQRSKWQKQRRGTPALDLNPWNFVTYLENHDQVANSGRGERLITLTHPALYRAMSAFLMLGPGTPMLFQGQEFGSTRPFVFFCDHAGGLGNQIHSGRREFLSQFPSLAQPEMQEEMSNPNDATAFQQSKLDLRDREKNKRIYSLYKDLIALRRSDPVLQRPKRHGMDGAILSDTAFLLRYFDSGHGDRLAIFNLGADLHLDPAPEPLLAPPEGAAWTLRWSSEDPRYGGTGTVPPDSAENWRVPAYSALLLVPGIAAE